MKTLIVLSALVSITIAAPALSGDGFNEFNKAATDKSDLTAREKKSPAKSNDFIEVPNQGTTSNGQSLDTTTSTGTGRSFGFKKPIIEKKKVGYHVYRDSDEEKEQATSHESCNEKVKVKLCNDESTSKSGDMLRSTVIEDIDDQNMSKDEMTHSLKMAKEAIENLERDLTKPLKSGTTLEKKNEDFGSDSVIQKDIEAARQALEHIHRNFGNLDSMSLRATTSKDAESLHDVHLTIAKTEEERLAQWKEAMVNINKNVEIARNIEDSFKSNTQELPSDESNLPVAVITDNIQEHTDEQKISSKENDMRTTKNIELNEEKLDGEKQCGDKSADSAVMKKTATKDEQFEDDMHPSASSVTEIKLKDLNNEKNMRNDQDHTKNIGKMAADNFTEHKGVLNHITESKIDITDHNPQARNSELDTTKFEHEKSMSIKADKDKTERKTNGNNNLLEKTLDNNFETGMTHLTGNMKFATSNQADNAMECNDNLDKNIKHEKSVLENSKDHKSNINAGQLQATGDLNNLKKSKEHSDEKVKMTQKNSFLEIENKEIESSNMPMKSFDHFETSFEESMGQSEDFMRTKLDRADNELALPSELKHVHTNAVMESAGNTNNGLGELAVQSSLQQSQDKNLKVDATLQKAAKEFKKDFRSMDQPANAHIANLHHMTGSSAHGHVHHMHQHDSRVHDHMFHNMDKTIPTMNMRDATGNFAAENSMFRWKPNQESARTAYGSAVASGASSGTSAVGMFPNANIGNCAVPILLSCSPSVTQGNLAKALPVGYGAPAYRTEDDFSIFPNKREIKKTNEIPGALAKKVLVNLKEKSTADLKH